MQGVARTSHDAADSPHVDGGAVLLLAEQQFRCAVPQCHNDRCHGLGGLSVLARQTKVRELEHALIVQQEIARLDVAVNDPVLVQVLHGLAQRCQHVIVTVDST